MLREFARFREFAIFAKQFPNEHLCFHKVKCGLLIALRKHDRMEAMLNIQRQSSNGRVVLSLSGRIEMEDVAELQRLLSLEAADQTIVLDLQDVTLIDRDAVKFLASWEAEGIQLVNCPAYIREWMGAERQSSQER